VESLTVSWFSAGGSSAVATKLVVDEIDKIFYIHIDDQHPDTLRFVNDCAEWFGREIETVQSPVKTVADAMRYFDSRGFGRWSPCTQILKRMVRSEWERENSGTALRYVWGMDYQEKGRADRILSAMPKQDHMFPLVDKKLSKEQAHEILTASGIKRPAMYELGYHNNNCLGCVKGGMGYWNKIRRDFPHVFAERAKLERELGGTFLKETPLDELDPEAGRHGGPIVGDCGILCQVIGL